MVAAALAGSRAAAEPSVDGQDFVLRLSLIDGHVEGMRRSAKASTGEVKLFLALSNLLFSVEILKRAFGHAAEAFL